jgi:hypothetical protein
MVKQEIFVEVSDVGKEEARFVNPQIVKLQHSIVFIINLYKKK